MRTGDVVVGSPGTTRAVGAYVAAAVLLAVAYVPVAFALHLTAVEIGEDRPRALAAGSEPLGWDLVLLVGVPVVVWLAATTLGTALLVRRAGVRRWRAVAGAAAGAAAAGVAGWYVVLVTGPSVPATQGDLPLTVAWVTAVLVVGGVVVGVVTGAASRRRRGSPHP